jgi:hypothetical protein
MNSFAYKLWDWVCHQIAYRSDNGEYWFFPSQTVARGAGDCDDSANLLTSLLRSAGFNAYTVVGSYRGFGHAWTKLDGEILETTYTFAHPVGDPQNYRAYAMFNDQEVIEMWPDALSQLFQLARDECSKLTLMNEAQQETAAPLGLAILGGIAVTGIMFGLVYSKAKGVRVEERT